MTIEEELEAATRKIEKLVDEWLALKADTIPAVTWGPLHTKIAAQMMIESLQPYRDALRAVGAMRQLQKLYFTSRDHDVLLQAKAAEKKVDSLLSLSLK